MASNVAWCPMRVRWTSKKYQLMNSHFEIISGHSFANYTFIFHKTEIQRVILRCLMCLNLNWVKSYDIFWLKYLFFHAWKSIISGVKYRSKFWYLRAKPDVMFSKWAFFQNSLGMLRLFQDLYLFKFPICFILASNLNIYIIPEPCTLGMFSLSHTTL